MNNEYLPYGKQNIRDEDIQAVVQVLKSEFLTQGPVVPEFEHAVCRYVNSEYAVAVNSATSALHIACMALDLKENEIVWTSSITFVASANCARFCRANVDFIDIDPRTGLICLVELEKKLIRAEKLNTLPRIIIPVHLSGTSCDMEKIHELSKKYGFRIIEDASHAIGGSYKGDKVGCCKYSDITIFSFHPVKIITSGEGGMACTNDKEIASKMRLLRSHGITKEENCFQHKSKGQWYYEQQMLGYNYRMNDINAALGISQLKRIDEIVERRNRVFMHYIDMIDKLPIVLLDIPPNVLSSLHLAIIRLKGKARLHHKEIFEGLRSKGIGVQLHYSPVHLNPYYRELGFGEGNFPKSENYASEAISLPIFPEITVENQERVIELLKKEIERHAQTKDSSSI